MARLGKNQIDYTKLTPSEMDWARLAAYVDGEGSILMTERHYPGKDYLGMYIRVVVSNCDPRLPRWCSQTFGGVFVVSSRQQKSNHRLGLKWHVSCRHAEWVLRNIRPYLLLKGEQADVALAFQETLDPAARRRGLGADMWEARKKMKQDLSDLRWQTFDVPPEVPSVPEKVN